MCESVRFETAGTGLVLAQPLTASHRKPKLFHLGPQAKAFGGPKYTMRCRILTAATFVFLCIPIRSYRTSRCVMATSLFPSPSSPNLSILKLKPFAPLKGTALPLPVASSLSASSQRTVRSGSSLKASERNPRAGSWRLRAAAEDALESSQQIVSSGDDGVSNVVSVLLLIAFAGLSILTIGVIYIAVTDFLQKREREKFEKEEAGKKKKGGKKGRVRARAGPRGFGQRIDEEDD